MNQENKANLFTIDEIKIRYPEFFEKDEQSLLNEWKLASDSYHNRGISIMSDERFDSLEIVFKQRFPENKEILNVGFAINENLTKTLGFEKVEHTRIKGKTQHKAQNITELEKNLKNLTNALKNKLKEEVEKGYITQDECDKTIKEIGDITKHNFIMSEKLDGVSLYATYNKKGELVSVVSRGDGEYGDNITVNAKKINGIVEKIDMSIVQNQVDEDIEFIEIRGEGIILNKNFKELAKIYETFGKELKNARNAAGGIMRRLDGQYLELIDFMPYEEIIELKDGTIFQRDEEIQMKTLDGLGFNTPFWTSVKDINSMEKEYKTYIETKRKQLRIKDDGYEIDGLVYKINENRIQQILGMVSNRQNGQVALKFPPEIAISKLIDIEWSESYNGIITPVAIIEPVTIGGVEEIDENGNIKTIGGVTIERLSLANKNIMDNLLLEIGDNIEISRRNDVIPKIERNLKMEEAYIEFHKFIQVSLIPEIDKFTLSLNQENMNYDQLKFKETLLGFKDMIEMNISTDMNSIELKINKIIREELFKDNEFLKYSYKNDRKVFAHIFREFTSEYKKDFLKLFEQIEKKYSKNENIKEFTETLFSNIKEKTIEIIHSIDENQTILKTLNENNIQFISDCPSCSKPLISDNSNQTCNNSECSNIKKGKIGTFITKNKNLIVVGEIGKVDKFFSNFSKQDITRENYIKTIDTELSLAASKIWNDFENGKINIDKLKTELEDEAKKAGIGDAKITELYEKGIATTIKDLFTIKLEDFIVGKDNKGGNIYLDGWGERAISNLIKDINKLSKLTDVQLLTGMNLKSAASSRLEKLLEKFNYKELINGQVKLEDITALKGFGENIAKDLLRELENKKDEILELLEVIEIKESKRVILKNEEKINFVITGSVEPMDKNNPSKEWIEFEKTLIDAGYSKSKKIDGKYVDVVDRTGLTNYLKKELGHEIQNKVTSTTHYLINLDKASPSSKNKDAQKLGIDIITPEEVLGIIEKRQELKKDIKEINNSLSI